ncbi:putative integral membrane protein [Diplodia seriata]|nr:putative integral membrane protein [Diplodia seriata]
MDVPAPKSIFARKRDLLYLSFFAIHIPIVFCVDVLPVYPEWMKPEPLLVLRQWYIDTYQDRFFSAPP